MSLFPEPEFDSFIEMAKAAYDRPELKTIEEFVEDFSRFKYIKRLVNRYVETKDIKTRLILNHMILLFNVFDKDVALYILFKNNKKESHKALRTFLYFTSQITCSESELDSQILEELRSI